MIYIITAISIIPSFAAIVLDMKKSSYYKFVKPVPLIIMCAALSYAMITSHNYAALFVLLALIFGLGGDIFMVNDKTFIISLLSFLVGHIFYLLYFASNSSGIVLASSLFAVSTIVYAIFFLKNIQDEWKKMRVPVCIYMGVITIMLMTALSADMSIFSKPALYTIGSIFFYSSDAMLAWDKMVRPLKHISIKVLGTYYIAQLLITLEAIYLTLQ